MFNLQPMFVMISPLLNESHSLDLSLTENFHLDTARMLLDPCSLISLFLGSSSLIVSAGNAAYWWSDLFIVSIDDIRNNERDR